jgi:hypothetical protein
MKGFAGIPGILSTEAFAGLETAGQLTGGRYRPLSVVTFAVEQGLFGTNPGLSHLVNVALYGLIVVLLFVLLHDHFFKDKPGVPFFSALIFAIHPVHTEVVANLKSRDELLSLLFLLISMVYFFRHWRPKNLRAKPGFPAPALGLFAYFLALLSKESALTFLGVIPLSSFYFQGTDWKASIRRTLPFAAVAGAYLALRYAIVGMPFSHTDEVLNSPFLLATGVERFATKVAVLGRYLLLLVLPHPLSYDYSYNQIPYSQLSDPAFILSFVACSALVSTALVRLKAKSVYAYGVLLYFITISVASNFAVDIGALMGERFLFQPSLGFAIVVGYGFHRFTSPNGIMPASLGNALAGGALLLLVVLSGLKTIARNRDWRDDLSLFSKDVHAAPNSAKTHNHLAIALLKTLPAADNEEEKSRAPSWHGPHRAQHADRLPAKPSSSQTHFSAASQHHSGRALWCRGFRADGPRRPAVDRRAKRNRD